MKFVATADWQLGMSAHFLPVEARSRYQQARFDAVARIGEIAASRGAEFVVVCGDVFESNQLGRAVVSRAAEALRGFTVPVVLLPGNHDPLDAASIYDSALFAARMPSHVHVIRDATPVEVVPGAEVVGAPWFSKRPTADLVAAATAPLEAPPPGVVRVIAGHGALRCLNPDRDSLATIDDAGLARVIEDGRAHVAIVGDRHSTYRAHPAIWYPGTPEVTDRREDDPGNVLLVDATDSGVSVEKIRVGEWSFQVIRDELNCAGDVEALAQRLRDLPGKDRTALWLALSGTLSTAAKAQLDEVVEAASEVFARVGHWARHTDLAVLPDGHDFASLGLGGFAADALSELSGLASGEGEDAATAQDALGLLYRLVGGAR
ncbi:MAG: exonuclease SbcCD subunit D [Propionibacteriaceae bacterium]|nr:exonuclease SbcCD subunit D [Propionibacteriaceae bacterium]